MMVRPIVLGCGMYLFGATNGDPTNGYRVCFLPIWPNQWWFHQWLLGVLCTCLANQWWFDQWLLRVLFTCLAQPMAVRPMVVGVCSVPVWPNQWWFDQWLLGVVCTCLAQPMMAQPMVVGCGMYLFGPTNDGSTNGYWVSCVLFIPTNGCCVRYVPVWPNQWRFDQWLLGLAQPMVVQPMVLGVPYLFGPTNGSDQLPVIEISQQGHRLQGGGQCWVSCS